MICEVLDHDGAPARFDALKEFASDHRIAIISVEQVAEHRRATAEKARTPATLVL
jgi:3,4-dihydroxy 2-butanone 4-phosphate synthase/GTP cyclohydrolase II